jgi:citrate lyase subunit beta/citryl-CoA lyase
MSQVKIGTENKGDCVVRVERGEAGIRIDAKPLVEPGLRLLVEQIADRCGAEKAKIEVADFGALDYVVAARLETALRQAGTGKRCNEPLEGGLDRKPTAADRLRRTRLYVPGNNPRLQVGIELHGADCILLDLEDSVPLSEKLSARVLVKHLLWAVSFDEVWVRINPLDTYGDEDLAEIVPGRPHGVCLPKTETTDDVARVAARLAELESKFGIPVGSTRIMAILETAAGVLHAEQIAGADPRVVVMAFGAEDFTRDVGSKRTRETLLFARSQLVAAARSAGVQASDTVFSDVDDRDALLEETRHVRDLGFDGKGAINPRQIAAIHEGFAPPAAEIEHARRVVAAAEEAEQQGIGAIAIGGKMIDRPVLDRARRTLDLAQRMSAGRGL